MLILHDFKEYTPSNIPAGLEQAIFMRTEDGRDWYEIQPLFKNFTLKVIFISNNCKVLAVNSDPSMLFPTDGTSVAEIDPIKIDRNVPYIYNKTNNTISIDIELKNRIKMQKIIAGVSKEIDKLRDEVITGFASKSESKLFMSLVRYRKDLEAVNISQTDITWPEKPK